MIRLKYYIFLPVIIMVFAVFSAEVPAVITGQCSGCHTMHNSQNGAAMVSYVFGAETTGPKDYLLVGTCLGCHAQGGSSMVANINGNPSPQVYHTDATGDLAGGNFAYILGTKGSGASDAKGHNVFDFGNAEDTLLSPPGHHDPDGIGVNITCAGIAGCHGVRKSTGGGIYGTHHSNVDGKLTTADQAYNSYRFLSGVKGLEDPDWQKTKSVSDHNEYFGAIEPMTYSANCNICHNPQGIRPSNNTMSGFCSTCHRSFHVTDAIGGSSSPFTRHPTDVILPGSGEYSGYNGVGNPYSLVAPVARTVLPDIPGDTVYPGTDVVMCLSCHAAHASDNADMMRWDYKSSTLSTALSGCNVCHTSKN